MPAAPYAAIIVTFRRPHPLQQVLQGLRAQDHPPSIVVVTDNDPLRSAEAVVHAAAAASPFPITYVPLGANLGPAGGWARAARHAADHPQRGEWLAVFDDDDPITHPHVMRRLGDRAAAAPPDVAALGLRGARLRPWSATLRRIDPATRGGRADVDYLASNGAPLYRWAALDEVGFFDEALFFGFEDLELGIRLRRRGLRLLVEHLEDLQVIADTAASTSWREYYKTRALVVICRRHLGPVALASTLVRALLLGAPRLLRADGGVGLARARWQGARDGIRGRLGPGALAPATNPPKALPPTPPAR